MRVAMIGTGYVGLVSGTCFSEFGHDVVCVDQDAAKIERLKCGEIPIYEPGLEALVASNAKAGRLSFTTDLQQALHDVDAVFIAVGTPSRRGDGYADLTYVYQAAEQIAQSVNDYCVVVTKSTVPVGTGRRVQEIITNIRPEMALDVASNPEFLREGSAIEDFMRPDRVVIGTENDRARQLMSSLYRPLFLNETPILYTSLESAELTKYAANAFLATKITFINEIADLCEAVGANVQDVARGIGLDGRIGKKFLNAGPGYGGSCFPKDTLALVRTAEEAGTPLRIVEAVVDVNERRKRSMVRKITHAASGGSVRDKVVAVLGVTFKPNTDDMRDAPSLVIIPGLQAAGAVVHAHDPAGRHEAEKLLPDVVWFDDPYQAMEGADVLVLMTEWNAYRALNMAKIKKLLKDPVIVDLRNVYKPHEMIDTGITYVSIGRGEPGMAQPSTLEKLEKQEA
jgi:UDPglucose 6-dehydrogenase